MDQYKFLQALFGQAQGDQVPDPDPFQQDKLDWDTRVSQSTYKGTRYPYGPDDDMYDPTNPMSLYGTGPQATAADDPSTRWYWISQALMRLKGIQPTETYIPSQMSPRRAPQYDQGWRQ